MTRPTNFSLWKRPGGRLLPYFCPEKRPGGAISESFYGTPWGAFTPFFAVYGTQGDSCKSTINSALKYLVHLTTARNFGGKCV